MTYQNKVYHLGAIAATMKGGGGAGEGMIRDSQEGGIYGRGQIGGGRGGVGGVHCIRCTVHKYRATCTWGGGRGPDGT
jgi:hypothetical protein